MPRARNIKPGFFANEDLVELEPITRLLFIGLWTLADREGRLEDRPKRIKIQLLPGDAVDVDVLLNELAKARFILRYATNSIPFIQIINFLKHQNPHVNEAPSTIPAPEQHQSAPADSLIPDSLIPESLTNCTVPLPRDDGRKAIRKAEALEYLDFLNAKAGKHFRPVPSNLRFIEARLAESVTLQDLKTLTVRKCREWLGTDQEKFLRPETLCNATKCHSYLGEIPPEVPCTASNATAPSPPATAPAPAAGSSPSDSQPADPSRILGMASALGRTLVAAGASTREH